MSKALIFGIGGQDGSYLAEILLEKGYEVHGTIRRTSSGNTSRIDPIYSDLNVHYADLSDTSSILRVLQTVQPDEIYNEADMDSVAWSYKTVAYSLDITGAAVGRLLESIRTTCPEAKVFQPLSSHMFGKGQSPQTESTCFNPQSPYACAKVMAYHLCQYYRRTFDMYVSCGILYNHESPRRSPEYVSRKITLAAARRATVQLGDVDALIDWGYARDYMEAAQTIMQLPTSDNYVIASGKPYSVMDWARGAYLSVGLKAEDYIEIDPNLLRPSRNGLLVGNTYKLHNATGWTPKVDFVRLVNMMVIHDEDNLS